ncbi:TlpA family protein disulfide reductase [Pedobacter africanus]|uniref:TlpA family protein disulfide reductase n=1 Tax=Pedobacter africanus TaxID=151894 RepID=UPI000A0709C3
MNDKTFTNSSLAGQNYLIVFCATWCDPCQQELPRLKEIYDQYKVKGLKVVYFNLDNRVELWKAYVLKNKLDWINVSKKLKAKVFKKFLFLINKTKTYGNIISS